MSFAARPPPIRAAKESGVCPPLWATKSNGDKEGGGDDGFFSVVGMGGSSLSSARAAPPRIPASKSMGSLKQRPASAMVSRRSSISSSSLDAKKPLQDFNRDPMMPSAPMTKSTSFPRAEWGSSSSSSSSSAGGTQTNNSSNSNSSNSKPPLTRPTTAHPRSRVEVQHASQHQNAADQLLEPPAGARQLAVRPTTAHPRSQSDEQKLQSGESPRIVGGAAAPPRAGAKCRPLSAMANMSRGQASTSEKGELEELKREIREMVRMISFAGKGVDGSKARRDIEETLSRYVYTNDAGQVQLAKSALLSLVLQKQEEFNRHALHEIDGGELGRVPQTRFGVMLGLVERARGLRRQFETEAKDHREALENLKSSRDEAKRLNEEKQLLLATLNAPHAGASGGLRGGRARPMTAPKQRVVLPVKDCGDCSTRRAAQEEAEKEMAELRAKVADLQAKLKESLQANSDNKPASAAVPNPAISTTEDNGGARLAELEGLLTAKNGRIITLEKTLAGKSADVARLLSELDAAKKGGKEPAKVVKEVVKDEAGRKEAERRAKSLADKLKAAEKALQDANGKIILLEKKLAEAIEMLKKAQEEGKSQGGGDAEGEVEKIRVEVRVLREELDKAKDAEEKAGKEVERLKKLLKEEKTEADAVIARLTEQMRELQGRVLDLQKQLEGRVGEVVRLEEDAMGLKERVKHLEGELKIARGGQGEAAVLEKRIGELQGRLEIAQKALGEYQEKHGGLVKEKNEREKELRMVKGLLGDAESEVERCRAEMEVLRSRQSGFEADRAELLVLRERITELEVQMQTAIREAGSKSDGEIAELRMKLDQEMKKVASLEAEAKRREGEMQELRLLAASLEKKLAAVMRKSEETEGLLLKVERDREETRATENIFKGKMKALYDKRIRELEATQRECEQQVAAQKEREAQEASTRRPQTSDYSTMSRPSTVGGSRRR